VPADIGIHAVRRVSPRFHAIASAEARRYEYHLLLGEDLFQPHCWQITGDLDRDLMELQATEFLGAHDFSSFCKTSSLKDDGNVCAVDLCCFQWSGDSAIFQVRADRFLHHMVRNMIGTLVDIGRGRKQATVSEILAERNRAAAGGMAPATGLFLAEVLYPENLLDPDFSDGSG
jgi:tRNA pseudouridine38-40 synthase